MIKRDLLHSILILAALHQIDRAVGALADEVHDFEAADELVFTLAGNFLEVAHLLKVLPDLSETLFIGLFIELFKEWDI